jgi:molybdopterin-synthase adenylyltransferase
LLTDSLPSLARKGTRQRQDFLIIEADRLAAWATLQGLTLRQAYEQALTAGIFPEPLERNFPTLSPQEQLRLFTSRVSIVGLGGLGGYQAQLLARVGVGRLLLADGDRFASSNLNRQLLATRDTLGQAKARTTAEFLLGINPALEVLALEEYLTPTSYLVHLPQVDLALDALDTFLARRQLLTAAREAGKPVIHGAVLGQDGQITTILPEDLPVFADQYLDQPSLPDDPPPVVAASVSLIASLQIQEALRLLLLRPPAYHGRLACWDGFSGRLDFLPLW